MSKPLQIFGLVGTFTFLPGLAICGSLVFARIFLGQSLADRPLFLLGILLAVIGAQFVSMGILAEIQIRTYHEAANKPIYRIREILKSDDTVIGATDRIPSQSTSAYDVTIATNWTARFE